MTAMADSKPKKLQVMPPNLYCSPPPGGDRDVLKHFLEAFVPVLLSLINVPCVSLTEQVQLVKRREWKHEACFRGDVALSAGDSRLLLQYREVI